MAARKKKATKIDLSYIVEDLWPLATPIGELVEDPANARIHPERNLEATMASLRLFKQRKPVVVNKNGMVVEAGNGTLLCARALGWTHIAAVKVEDDPATAAGYAIADNRTAELAQWDEDALAQLLGSVDEVFALDDLGFTDKELEELLQENDLGIDLGLGDGLEGFAEGEQFGSKVVVEIVVDRATANGEAFKEKLQGFCDSVGVKAKLRARK